MIRSSSQLYAENHDNYHIVKNRPVYATAVSIRRVTNILANIWCFIIYGSFVFIKKYIQ